MSKLWTSEKRQMFEIIDICVTNVIACRIQTRYTSKFDASGDTPSRTKFHNN